MDEAVFHRQLSIYNPNDAQIPVTILGAGMIGSPTAWLLSKLGIEDISIWDGDKIEKHNFPNQMYPKSAVGNFKVESLKQLITEWSYSKLQPVPEYWDDGEFEGIVISGVDSLEVRKKIFDKVKFRQKIKMFIDGRIGGQQISVYCIDPLDYNQCKYYESTLVKKAEDLPCSQRGVIDVSFFTAGLITRSVREFLVNKKIPWKCIVFDASELEIVKYLS